MCRTKFFPASASGEGRMITGVIPLWCYTVAGVRAGSCHASLRDGDAEVSTKQPRRSGSGTTALTEIVKVETQKRGRREENRLEPQRLVGLFAESTALRRGGEGDFRVFRVVLKLRRTGWLWAPYEARWI